jgi:N12 class adenine-specific DNA methylase
MRKRTLPGDGTLWLPGFEPTALPHDRRSLTEAAARARDALGPMHPMTQNPRAGVTEWVPTRGAETPAPFPEPSLSLWESLGKVPEPILALPEKPVWPRLATDLHADLGARAAKFEANLRAMTLLKLLEEQDRAPDESERHVLNRYTGWGALPQAFDPDHRDVTWRVRAQTLSALLGEQYEGARASVLNAHYTEPFVIEAMWKAVERLGFRGGRIIEPAAGVGYFLAAMPAALARHSEITAIELEPLSARLLKALYGPYDVIVRGGAFEKTPLPKAWYDLAISNVPFGNYCVPEDRNTPYAQFLIHDYFFARALDLVRPGGLIAFITSSGTLDKSDPQARRYLAHRARLLGTIRLPSSAFAHIANTKVTTDMVFLRRLMPGEHTDAAWTGTGPAPRSHCAEFSRPSISNWYVQHPDWLIGDIREESNGYRLAATSIFEGDLPTALDARISLLPERVYTPREPRPATPVQNELRVSTAEHVKPGAYCLTEDNRLAVFEAAGLRVLEGTLPANKEQRIRGLIGIRNAARNLLSRQCVEGDDAALAPYQAALNGAYDRFVRRHGFIHERANTQAFRSDPDLPLLLSLEYSDPENRQATKAELFTRRTVGTMRRVERCDTPEEALQVSLHERAVVDVGLMVRLLGQPESTFITQLSERGILYRDPQSLRWETADAYLSGNVRQKLHAAEVSGPAYSANVTALKAVIPPDLGPGEIDGRIGSTWIPLHDYAAFLDQLLDCSGSRVEFSALVATWEVQVPDAAAASVAATQTYGTVRVPAPTLFRQALNLQLPTVRDLDRKTARYLINKEETIAARERQQQLRERFRDWLFADSARAERLVRCYNDTFNAIRPRTFDGSALTLPGYSKVYELDRHQKDATWRIVTSPANTLLAHAVGAGKTLTMICAGMELRRLGLIRKPCYVVPNNMLEQFTAEFVRAYPSANVLMASRNDLQGDKRRHLLCRIATGNWDGVLLTHASFESIKMSQEAMKGFIDSQLDEILAALREYGSRNRRHRIVKELERAKKDWQARLARFSATHKKSDLLVFEELGIDWLMVDEAHFFKNLYRFTKLAQLAGLPNTNSERAFDMFVKTRHVMSLHDDRRGVTFATGTPIPNSIAELWTTQRFLQPNTLQAHQLEQFDSWVGNFAEAVTALEASPEGAGYRMHTRFARFVNIPELMRIFGEVADIKTAEMLKLPVPEHQLHIVAAKPSPELKALVQTLVSRAEAIRDGHVRPDEDNMLSVTTTGRMAAVDLRLIDPTAPDIPDGKVNLCVKQVHEIWLRTAEFRGTQLVFCDVGTPKRTGFSVYQDIRDKLIILGIPESEIAFVQDATSDAAKAALFKSVRERRVRIILGSTQKLGVGTNAQTWLVAIHHLDGPWRPADVQQRDGRILRRGNLNGVVWIYRYVTEGSFDVYTWQTLETKEGFIGQIMRADAGLRTAQDLALTALSYAEVKAIASGNPLIIEKAGIDSEVTRLTLLKSQWMNQRWHNQREVAWLPGQIARTGEWIAAIEADRREWPSLIGTHCSIEINGRPYTHSYEAGAAVCACYLQAAATAKALPESAVTQERMVGRWGDFRLMLQITPRRTPSLRLVNRRSYNLDPVQSAEGFAEALKSAADGIEPELVRAQTQRAREEKLLADLELTLSKSFEKEARLAELLRRQGEINALLDLDRPATETLALDAEAA